LYSSPILLRRIIEVKQNEVCRACSANGEETNACRILEGRQKEIDHQETRRRWVDNIKMGLGEIGWDGMDWIDLAQDRDQWRALVNTAMNLWVP
jgi:hypothetical protein